VIDRSEESDFENMGANRTYKKLKSQLTQ